MTNEPIHLSLYRIDPSRNMQRFYEMTLQPNLFGGISLMRNWGRIGRSGQFRIDLFDDEAAAASAFQKLASAKQRKGYFCPRNGIEIQKLGADDDQRRILGPMPEPGSI
ncbi:WGR domain-containing protein [Roseibium sp. SCP14]|uniref:WGR domain-containing protein n=1 Tax=Roseibium sp. SCP14 TaxID=3141375 RepID=UPI003337F229